VAIGEQISAIEAQIKAIEGMGEKGDQNQIPSLQAVLNAILQKLAEEVRGHENNSLVVFPQDGELPPKLEALRKNYEAIPANLIVNVLMAANGKYEFKSAAVANAIAMLGPGFEGIVDDGGKIVFIAQDTEVTAAVGEMYKAREAALRKA